MRLSGLPSSCLDPESVRSSVARRVRLRRSRRNACRRCVVRMIARGSRRDSPKRGSMPDFWDARQQTVAGGRARKRVSPCGSGSERSANCREPMPPRRVEIHPECSEVGCRCGTRTKPARCARCSGRCGRWCCCSSSPSPRSCPCSSMRRFTGRKAVIRPPRTRTCPD
ncbi:hypothetical protein [Lysobacter gummosus]|uniref:hypothetical protein n=1 Tax=Lysobacter gummosus TaxID=262324 RepID=UPI00362A80A3